MRLSQTRESLCVRRRCVPSNPLAKLARLPLLHLVLVPMLAKPYPDSYSNVRPPLAIQQNQVKETAPLSTTLFGLALVPSIRRPVAFFLLLPRPRAWKKLVIHLGARERNLQEVLREIVGQRTTARFVPVPFLFPKLINTFVDTWPNFTT